MVRYFTKWDLLSIILAQFLVFRNVYFVKNLKKVKMQDSGI